MFGKRISEEHLAELVDAAVARKLADELAHSNSYAVAKSLAALKSNVAALYKHLGIERVEVRTSITTENLLTGLRNLATEVREEMRKVPKVKE